MTYMLIKRQMRRLSEVLLFFALLGGCADEQEWKKGGASVPPFGYVGFCLENPEHFLCAKN